MRSLWKVWVEAKDEDKALRVCGRLQKALGRGAVDQGIEPYPKISGFLVRFEVEIRNDRWNDCVVEVIQMGQKVGHEWIIGGDIRRDASGWSSKPSIPGVKAIEWGPFH